MATFVPFVRSSGRRRPARARLGPLTLLLLAFALLGSACDRTAELIPGDKTLATATARSTPPPVVAPPILPPRRLTFGSDSTGAAIEAVSDTQLAPSVVQVLAMQGETPVRSGSGVVVDGPQRLILTSYQVVEPFALDGTRAYSTLTVAATRTVGEPAQPAFQAQIVRADPALGIAVLRASRRLDGSPLEPGEFDLPPIPPGDAVKVNRGDQIRIFGYPGLQPESPEPQVLLATEASVLGFRGDAGMSGIAWLKTQARLSFGHNGAPVFDPQGRLLGVALQASYSGAAPVGQIRPIALATRVIEDARQAGPESVFAAPLVRRPAAAGPVISRPAFAENALDDGAGDLFDYTQTFPETLNTLNYEFVAQGLAPGTIVEERWFLNGVLQDGLSSQVPWSLGAFEVVSDRLRAPTGRTLQTGTWRLEIWADRQLRASSEAYVGVAQPRQPEVTGFEFGSAANPDGTVRDPARGNQPQIVASFHYQNAGGAHQLRWIVFHDGRVVYQSPTIPWEGGEAGTWWVGYAPGTNVGAGSWEFEVYLDGQIVGSDGTRIF